MEFFFDYITVQHQIFFMLYLLCVTEVLFVRKHVEFTWPVVLVQNIYEKMIENISILTSNFEACLPFANFWLG